MDGEGLVQSRDRSKSSDSDSSDSDSDDSSKESKSSVSPNEVLNTDPPNEVVLDTDVNTVVSALDKADIKDSHQARSIPTTAAVTQSPLNKNNPGSDSESDLSVPVQDMVGNKIYPDMTKDGKFFYQLKEKAELVAKQTKR